jgi:hypothetical protein
MGDIYYYQDFIDELVGLKSVKARIKRLDSVSVRRLL